MEEKYNINELLTNLDSFELKDTLNTKIWNSNDKMKTEVRKVLLKISEDLFNSLHLKVYVTDVIITGSMANYNWSEYSDIDLHLLVDFNKIIEQLDASNKIIHEPLDFIKDYFDAKKALFNSKYKIKICGYDVEVYIQDINEKHVSDGIYSLINDDWIITPKHIDFKLDQNHLMRKITSIANMIDKNDDAKILNKLKDKIKKFRNDGLNSQNRELSDGNIIFKALRRGGDIDKLFSKLNSSESDMMSLTEDVDPTEESLNGKKIYSVKLRNDEVAFKQAFKKDYVSVYVQVYENGEHVIKKWSVVEGNIKSLIASAKKWNDIKVPQLKKKFSDYSFARITAVYIVKPELIGKSSDMSGLTSIDLKFAEIK